MRRQPPPPHNEAPESDVVDLNVAVRLLDKFVHAKRYALAYVDSLGVIERLTSADAVHKATEWAYLLRTRGVRPGDRVIVLAARDREWRFALLGVMQVGAVAVPCPAGAPVEEIRAIAADAGAVLVVSARARPDLADPGGTPVLSGDDISAHAAARAEMELIYRSKPGDLALVLYTRDAAGLRGVAYTHTALIAQAEAGRHWLGVQEGERVWHTGADGSVASIWVLLATWHASAEIVTVDLEVGPAAQLELLDKLHPSAVWLADDEYAALAPADAPPWVTLASVRRGLTSDEAADGAIAFEQAFGAKVAPVYGLVETGVFAGWPLGREAGAEPGTGVPLPGIELVIVDEQGTELPPGEVGAVCVRGGAASFFSGYNGAGRNPPGPTDWFRLGRRGAVDADGRLRLAPGAPLELEQRETVTGVSVAERVEEAPAAEAAPAVVAGASQAPSRDDLREEEERRESEERRRAEEAERAAAEERRRAEEAERAELEEAERAEREATLAEERRRAEEDKRRAEDEKQREKERRREEKEARHREKHEAKERQKAQAQRIREETEALKLAARAEEEERRKEEQLAKEREKAEGERRRDEAKAREQAERAELEGARAEESRRAEDEKRLEEQRRREEKEERRKAEQLAKERKKADEHLRREEAKRRKLAEAALAEEQRLAEEAEQKRREAARAEERRRAEEEKRQEEQRLRDEEEARRNEERQAKERAKTEETARKAALAEQRRRAEEEKRREEQRLRDEKEARRREEREAKEREKAEERRRRNAARSENGKRRKQDRGREAPPEQPERDRLAPDILGVLGAYGVKEAEPDEPREAEASSAQRGGTPQSRS